MAVMGYHSCFDEMAVTAVMAGSDALFAWLIILFICLSYRKGRTEERKVRDFFPFFSLFFLSFVVAVAVAGGFFREFFIFDI